MPRPATNIEAALVEPLATPVQAVAKAGDLTGRTVAVLGAGPIGLLTLLAARHAGSARIAVTDVMAGKRERALRLGADAGLPADAPDLVERTHAALGGPADVVLSRDRHLHLSAGGRRQGLRRVRRSRAGQGAGHHGRFVDRGQDPVPGRVPGNMGSCTTEATGKEGHGDRPYATVAGRRRGASPGGAPVRRRAR
ncbi:zinc-binding dehydrogenase [Streptomyces cyaneochromogenes]|uniref:zinc-binding dehydrogenase n=1 Tax=Streptomyces cyaneochromogenes TaxID=2496836 RepID=UPI002B1F8789|nr:zinc-binding dehydrogenase [Streptomyces cyaneochromogenes]